MRSVILHGQFFTRAERFFQQDFSSVRVIFSFEPAAISALAFARGQEIHIAAELAACPSAGLSRIMAHELAHVVQQRAGRVPGAAGSVVIDRILEAEAEACAALFAAGAPVAPVHAGSIRPSCLRGSSVIQPIRRDKYMFIPAAAAAAPIEQGLKRKYDEFLLTVRTAFTHNKNSRSMAAAASHRGMVSSLQSGGNRAANAAVLLKYEQAHLEGGGNWASFKNTLSNLRLRAGEGVSVEEEIIQIEDGAETATIKCKLRQKFSEKVGKKKPRVWYEFDLYTLGTVLFGDGRFAELNPQPPNLLNAVYVRGKVVGDRFVTGGVSQRHYVYLDNSDTYVKRFVVRGINHEDAAALGGNQNLAAPVQGEKARDFEISNPVPLPKPLEDKNISGRHGVAKGTDLSEKQQIISHTRGWQKRYISTGVSKRDAYSTRGEKFDGIYGAVLVDLAMVDADAVFDLHTPAAAQTLLGLDAMTVSTATSPGLDATTTESEEFLALRDVLRTRELLIKETVPVNSVRQTDLGKKIVGIGRYSRIDEQAMLDSLAKLDDVPKWKNTDIIEYSGLHDRYWFFMLFANATDAGKMLTALRKSPINGEEYIQLSAYGIPNNVDGR